MKASIVTTSIICLLSMVLVGGGWAEDGDSTGRILLYEPAPEDCHWTYEPQSDITAYELTQILPIFSSVSRSITATLWIAGLPDNSKRHFKNSCKEEKTE